MDSYKKYISFLILWSWIPLCFLAVACGGEDEDQALIQTSTTNTLQELRIFIEELAGGFQDSTNCTELEAYLNQISGEGACKISGTKTTSFSEFSCNDGPLLNASLTLTQIFQECQETPINASGTLNTQLQFIDPDLDALLQASGLVLNGLPYSFSNLSIMINGNGAASCAGVLIVLGETCGVSQNCNFCPF